MSRTYLITGSSSGIGLATKTLMIERGNKIIGVDLRDADINVDLGTPVGRQDMIAQAEALSGGVIDGLVAGAGVSFPAEVVTRVNYFGMLATLQGLRHLLARSAAPRAVAISSFAAIWPGSDKLLAALKSDNEEEALVISHELDADARELRAEVNWRANTPGPTPAYNSAKLAIAQWVRRMAPTADWAGAGIALNVIAPGMIITRLTEHVLQDEEALKASEAAIPRPLNDVADASVVAKLLAWLTSEENTHMCGQVIFLDGGAEAITRGVNMV